MITRSFREFLSKLVRFRQLAAILLGWTLGINTFLAFQWLRPATQKRELILERVKDFNLNLRNVSILNMKTFTRNDADSQGKSTIRLQKVQNNAEITTYMVNLAQVKAFNFSDFDIVDSKTSGVKDSSASFVLIIPRSIDPKSFNRLDTASMFLSAQILQAVRELDGLACLPRKLKYFWRKREHFTDEDWKSIFNTTWCNFARRDWSIQIRNNGFLKRVNFKSTRVNLDLSLQSLGDKIQMCNIFNGPFILRKQQFIKLKGLETKFGRTTMLDFFLRSNGKLKIGKWAGCFYSNYLFYLDRGRLKETHDFPDYSDFGLAHGVLRIVMEDRIEWTKCVANDRLCKEKPYVPPSTLPDVGQPICCSVVLGKMLKDIVAVFQKLGIKYRLLYGTLLGALRSEAIIPYVFDLDFAVDDYYALNWSNYDTLQPYFTDRYSISGNSFMGMPRLLPSMPVHLNIHTSGFFDGELDLEGKKLFSQEILESVRSLLPFSSSNWRTRGYADFYRGWDVWWKNTSFVKVDGLNYTAMKETLYEVELWYGKNWRTPILSKFESQNDAGAA